MNICIVEDHLLLAQGIEQIIRSTGNSNVKTYLNAELFLDDQFTAWKPDILLVDLNLPGINGLELIDLAKAKIDNIKIIVLTSVTDINVAKKILQKGINGYLTKDLSTIELLEAIKEVYNNGYYINKSQQQRIIKSQFSGVTDESFNLSRREKEVLEKICEGYTPKEISSLLDLSTNTINHYIRNMMAKLKVNRTTELVILAVKTGLYKPPSE